MNAPETSQSGSLSHYTLLHELGKGSFSRVYLALHKPTASHFAIKIVEVSTMDKKSTQSALNEIRILCSVSHPSVIGYKEAFLDEKNNLCVVMEFAKGGDVAKLISECQQKDEKLSESQIWSFFIQILQGLESLHNLKIMHRDIKPANLFLSEDRKAVKIGDLNVAKVAHNKLANTQVGTPYYLAPEIWKHENYSNKCDVFSLGCVMFELAALKVPFEANNIAELYGKVMSCKPERIPLEYSKELNDTIQLCLEKNPFKRPSASELLSNPLLSEKSGLIHMKINCRSSPQLMNTILVPKDISNLKSVLPSKLDNSIQNRKPQKSAAVPTKKDDSFVKKPNSSAKVLHQLNMNLDLQETKKKLPLPKNIKPGSKKLPIVPKIEKMMKLSSSPKPQMREESKKGVRGRSMVILSEHPRSQRNSSKNK